MVKPLERVDFEAANAEEWEKDSTIPGASQSTFGGRQTAPAAYTTSATVGGPRAPPPTSTTGKLPLRNVPVPQRLESGPSPSVNTTSSTKRRPFRAPLIGRTGASGWSRGPVLETTRTRIHTAKRQHAADRENKFLGQPDVQGDLPGTGYYMWPKNIDVSEAGSNHPRDLFGSNLESLDLLRKEYSVYIIWDEQSKCIKVMSKSQMNAQFTTKLAIQGIRNELRNTNARQQCATPLYLVNTPVGVMQHYVAIKSEKKNSEHSAAAVITGFKLVGLPLPKKEQDEWDSSVVDMQHRNFFLLRDHLAVNTTRLAPIRKWMRMRVHFGNVHLHKYKKDVRKPGLKFSSFKDIMTDSRTTRRFDRGMDSAIARMLMQKIIGQPTMFCPNESRFYSLQKILPKHTLVMFFESDSQNVRVEAALERTTNYEDIAAGWGTSDEVKGRVLTAKYTGGYQVGTTLSFYNSGRSKRAEVTTVDIQKGLDWTLEIIEDDTFPETPSTLLALIQGCVHDRTKDREDLNQLGYPAVDFKGREANLKVSVSSLVIKSVYEYVFVESQYIVEITVYRSWDVGTKLEDVKQLDGTFRKRVVWGYKRTEPQVQTSVSLYHSVWDYQTSSIEHGMEERNWDNGLKCFFEEPYQVGGMKRFLEEVAFVQDMLVDAEKNRLHEGAATSSGKNDTPADVKPLGT